jgi:hypothetical protein
MRRHTMAAPTPLHPDLPADEGEMSRLPPIPDFERIEGAASGSVDQRARILNAIGDINFAWVNNESLLIYFIMLLLKTDEASAAVVFSTLNTTRARLDLVERLAKTHIRDTALRKRMRQVLDMFSALTRIRNDMNHSMFVVGEGGELTHTQTLKLVETKGRLSFGQRQALDHERLAALSRSASQLKSLNRDMWELLPAVDAAMQRNDSGGKAKIA